MKRVLIAAVMVLAFACTEEDNKRLTDYEACARFSKGSAASYAACANRQMLDDAEFKDIMEEVCGFCDDNDAWVPEQDANDCIDGLVFEYSDDDEDCHATYAPPECDRMVAAVNACASF